MPPFTVTPELLAQLDPELAGGLGGLGTSGTSPGTMDLLRGGSMLSGFAAGMQGKENPVASQVNAQMQNIALGQQRRQALAQSAAQHSATLAETARGHTLLDQERKDTRALNLLRFKNQVAWEKIKTGIPSQIKAGFADLNTMEGNAFTDDDITKATNDSVFRDTLAKHPKLLAAQIRAGTVPSGVVVPPEYTELARSHPDEFAAAFDIKSPAEIAALNKDIQLKTAIAELRMSIRGKLPTPSQLAFLSTKGVVGYDDMLGLAYAMVAAKEPLPPALQDIYNTHARLKKLELENKSGDILLKTLRAQDLRLMADVRKDPLVNLGRVANQIQTYTEIITELQLDTQMSPTEQRETIRIYRGRIAELQTEAARLSQSLPSRPTGPGLRERMGIK